MTSTRTLRRIGKGLGLLLGLASVTLVGSQVFGGPLSMVLVHGSSMEPAYRQGDLVLVRRAEYHPGDAVAYRSAKLDAIVLHRITRVDGDRFVLKGDNNAWLDPERPSRSELVGRHLLRLPVAGTIIAALRTPQGISLAVAGTALAVAAGAMTRRRRRRGQSMSPSIRPSVDRSSPLSRLTGRRLPLGLGIGSLVLVALSATTFLLPVSAQSPDAVNFEHTGTFAYSARVPTGPVYGRGEVSTGEPVYLNVVSTMDVHFDYRFGSDAAADTDVRGRLLVEVADDTGWKHSMLLQPTTEFEGAQAVLRGRLDLKQVWRVVEQVQRLTGIQSSAYSLALIPHLHVTGKVADQAIDERFAPRLAFRLDRLLLRLAPSATPAGASADEALNEPLAPTQRGTLKAQSRGGSEISIGTLDIDAAAARRVSIIAALACIAALALVTSRGNLAAVDRAGEVARILRRYHRWIVPVASRQARPEGTVVDVSSIEDLLRLADHSGRMILHQNGSAPAVFFIEDDVTTYRYAPEQATKTNARSGSTGEEATEAASNGSGAIDA